MSESTADTVRDRRMKLQQDRQFILQQLVSRLAGKQGNNNPQLEKCLRHLLQYRRQGRATQARFRLFAYNLYCSKPQIYRRLKPLLQLPNERIFQNYKLYLAPEFEKCILYFLSSKLNSLRTEVNHFVLCVDQQPLNRNYVYDTKKDIMLGLHNVNGAVMNQPACMASVIMLRNLCVNWVQPVAYAFHSVSITSTAQVGTWVANVISKLLEIGLQVEAVVSRPDSISQVGYTNVSDSNRTDITFRGTKVYQLHDVRILIEGVRNCLIKNDFYYNESRISWHYIKLLYYQLRDSGSELIPEIKEIHIFPSSGQGSQWKYAKEIFSLKVYAALEQMIGSGALPHEARPTANFVRAMSELYQAVSFSPRARAAGDVADQRERLQRAADMFRHIRRRAGDVPGPITQMRAALLALAALLQKLTEKGFETVYTSRLNNAPLHAFFRAVPRTVKPGRRLKPTASQVYRAFTAEFARGMRRRTRWARREDLAEAAACGLLDARRVPAAALPPRSLLRLPRGTHYRVPLPRTPGAETSFLLHHCMRVHSCPELEAALRPRRHLLYNAAGSKVPDGSRELWDQLLEPPGLFQRYVQELREQLPKTLKVNKFRWPGAAALRQLALQAERGAPCACFPRRLLLTLLVRLRLWHALKHCNQRLRQGNGKGVTFLLPWENNRHRWASQDPS